MQLGVDSQKELPSIASACGHEQREPLSNLQSHTNLTSRTVQDSLLMMPTAQLGFAREPTQTDHACILAGAEASTRWVCLALQPVCICCQRPDLRLGVRQWALLVCTARSCEICCPAERVQGTVTSWLAKGSHLGGPCMDGSRASCTECPRSTAP